MKIISGIYKNRVIPTSKKLKYRPSTSKFREAVFNILTSNQFSESLTDANILDIFSGSGSLAFEALSRGNNCRVTLIDKCQEALKISYSFAKKLGIEDKIYPIRKDVLFLGKSNQQYDIIFLDPPYNKQYVEIVINKLIEYEYIAKDALIIIEMSILESLKIPQRLEIVKEKLYGKTKLLILKNNSDE